MRILLALLILAVPFVSRAADRITATVTITNAPTTNGMTFVITTTAASTRTWTNSVTVPASQILTNAAIGGVATNLYNHVQANPPAGVTLGPQTTTNTVVVLGRSGDPLIITFTGNYATVSYATQAVSSALTVRVPLSVEADVTKTNISSGLSAWLEHTSNTNPISQASTAMSEMVGLTNAQTVSGVKSFTGTNTHQGAILNNPILTNGVNYGNAFSSPGSGTNSQQFGSGATASALSSTAVGYGALATGTTSTAIGASSAASTTGASALGQNAAASGLFASAMGSESAATKEYSVAVGAAAVAGHTNSTAIGANSSTTAANQIMLGAPGLSVYVHNNLTNGGNLEVIGTSLFRGAASGTAGNWTNGTFYAPTLLAPVVNGFLAQNTNTFAANSDVAFTRYAITSLANGNNAAVPVGTNVFVEVSGPSGAFTINGIANGRDGKLIIIVNQTGQDMTVAHQSGTDPTAGNRIISMTGADRTTTANGAIGLIYSGAASRWILVWLDP